MRAGMILLAGMAAVAAADDAQDAAPALPRLIATRETTFSIPINAAAIDPARSAGIELLVSVDRGQSWHVHASEPPGASWFVVRTRGDGEYWFASRLVPKGGGRPEEIQQPELRVLVDTAPPQIELTARAEADGRVEIAWKAGDWWLAALPAKVEYRPAGNAEWLVAPVEGKQPTDGTHAEGTASVWLAAPARLVEVRLQAADAAGNTSETMRRVIVPFAAAPPASTARPADAPVVEPPPDPFSRFSKPHEGAETWPGEEDAPPAARPSPDASAEVTAPARSMGPRPVDERPSPDAGAEAAVRELSDLPSPEQVGGPVARPVGDRRDPAAGGNTGGTTIASSAVAEQVARWTNRREFPLAYEIDAVGPSGVESVELWITSDRGRTWRRFKDDPDRTSPIHVTVPEDGLYGFRIVVHNRDGLASEAPAGGDEADLWVGVDASPLEVRLTAAPYGRGAEAGSLVIAWQAVDARLADNPITLQFSREAHGPWTTIAAGLPNTGQYAWRVEPHVPQRVYLRIEAADTAGNVSEHVLAEAVNLAGLRPQGRVRGILPE